MARTILMHVNVIVPDKDGRDVPEIVGAIEAAIEVGSDHDSVRDLKIETIVAEVVGW